MADDPMWCLVMFDLPVKTAAQRRMATAYRMLLLDRGFVMLQLSVYVRYTPSVSGDIRLIKELRQTLPAGGMVQVTYVTDKQWAKSLRFSSRTKKNDVTEPQQLAFF